MMNNISIIGRLTQDPELRYTANGTAVCEFNIACNRLNEGTDFITCVCWNKQAENLNKYQSKGKLVAIQGRLTTSKYQGNDNKTRYKTFISVNELEYLTPKGKIEKTENEYENMSTKTTEPMFNGEQIQINDNDLPF